jgi:hypothetical protein
MKQSKSKHGQSHGLPTGYGSTILLNTVAENKAKYTLSDYKWAEAARTIQIRICQPSTERYMVLADKGRIRNCDVTQQDIINAKDIFGPEHGSLKGKTVRKASDQVRAGGMVPIPATIMAHYRRVVLCINVMKMNKIPFLVTMSCAIKFGMVAWLKNAKTNTILSHIKEVRNVYVKRGFLLELIEANGQFEPLREELAALGVTLNKCSREEHVPLAERRIRTLKECCRCICNTLPFRKLLGMLVVQMVSTCNFWLNVFPPKDGISRDINPRELITGVKIDFNRHIQAQFGEYVQVHKEHNNSMQTRTTGTVATKPTDNAQGGHWFYSLTTGRMLDRRRWTPLPMPGDVIDRIHELAKANQAGMQFTNMQNEDYTDDGDNSNDNSDDDSSYDSDDDSSTDDNNDYDDFIAGVDMPNNNSDPNDPPMANAEETHPNTIDSDDKENAEDASIISKTDDDALEDDVNHDASEDEMEDNDKASKDGAPIIPTALKKLTDHTGTLPPTIGSRTHQQANDTGENLSTTVTVTKKQRKLRKALDAQLLKRYEAETKRKLRNKLKNERKRKSKLQRKKADKDTEEPVDVEDLRDQL